MRTDTIIGKCTHRNELIKVGLNHDVMDVVTSCYEMWKDQPQELVADLYGMDTEKQCEAVFGYLVNNVAYKLDTEGNQFVKSPARLLSDGCGDCKSLTMFISCCLHCLHIPHIIRFVDFEGDGNYTHVYPVAIVNGEELVMDMCEKDSDKVILFGYARPFVQKRDYKYNE